jgi:hypothetical protein
MKHADNEYASNDADTGASHADDKEENFGDKSRNLRNTLQFD